MKFFPVSSKVVCKPIPNDGLSHGGIVLPETALDKPDETGKIGEIVAFGPMFVKETGLDFDGVVVKTTKILYSTGYGCRTITLEGQDYVLLDAGNVISFITDDSDRPF